MSLNAWICWLFILCTMIAARAIVWKLGVRAKEVAGVTAGTRSRLDAMRECSVPTRRLAGSLFVTCLQLCIPQQLSCSCSCLHLRARLRTLISSSSLCLIWFFAPSLALTRKLFSPAHIWLKLNARSRACRCDALCIILLLRRLSRRGRVARRSSQKWICRVGVASTRR
jgi:hypothetical protein